MESSAPPKIAYNFGGYTATLSSPTPFTLNGFYLTAAFKDGLKVEIEGFLAGIKKYSTTLVVNATGSTLETLNWSGLDKVSFSSSGGVSHPGYTHGPGSATQFVLDNLTYTPIPAPLPASVLLLGSGVLGLGALRRRVNG